MNSLRGHSVASPRSAGPQVVAVEVDLVGLLADLAALQQASFDVRLAGGGQQRRQHVLVRADVVDDGAGLDDAGPADERTARGSRPPSSCSSRRGTSWCRRRASVNVSAPLSVEYMTMVFSSMPSSFSLASTWPTCPSCSTMPSG